MKSTAPFPPQKVFVEKPLLPAPTPLWAMPQLPPLSKLPSLPRALLPMKEVSSHLLLPQLLPLPALPLLLPSLSILPLGMSFLPQVEGIADM